MIKSRTYDSSFFDYIDLGARKSSLHVVPVVLDKLDVSSVLDVGCGRGVWLSTWSKYVDDVFGLDSGEVGEKKLAVAPGRFSSVDLSCGFDLGRKFSLVQCLEVAEHLPPDSSDNLVRSLCMHSDFVLFSAATPGQGGVGHINENSYSYWRELFSRCGYVMFDPFRAVLCECRDIEPWYKYNLFLFVNSAVVDACSNISMYRVEGGVCDYSSMLWKLRLKVVGIFPPWVIGRVARIQVYVVLAVRNVLRIAGVR